MILYQKINDISNVWGRGFVCLFVRLFLFVVEYLASSHCTSHIFALHHRFDW
jgi:hypothetical protein